MYSLFFEKYQNHFVKQAPIPGQIPPKNIKPFSSIPWKKQKFFIFLKKQNNFVKLFGT